MIIRARAPLRLGIAGGGTDVSPFCDRYGGYVLNASIAMYAYAVLRPREDNRISFSATDRNESFTCETAPFVPAEGDLQLHKGVYNRIMRDFNGGRPIALDLVTYSDAMAGSGLGSSSTLVVTMIKAFVELLNLPLGEYEIAHLAYEVERQDLGLAGGKQDQYAATFGGINFMEFYKDDRVIVNPLRVKNWIVSELESSLLLYFTGLSRDSASIIQDQVRNVSAGADETTGALQALKDDALRMKEHLLRGEIRQFAECLDRSWQAKKRVSKSIATDLINETYEAAKRAGALAGKVSGAGGGGFMMFLVDPARRMAVIEALSRMPGRIMPCHFAEYGTQSWRLYDG
ncbi:MAG: dehydrogenase [Gammaproteobacteria bacterium]|nr:dehydrogenase [Gammaproteobacteria bacterium]